MVKQLIRVAALFFRPAEVFTWDHGLEMGVKLAVAGLPLELLELGICSGHQLSTMERILGGTFQPGTAF